MAKASGIPKSLIETSGAAFGRALHARRLAQEINRVGWESHERERQRRILPLLIFTGPAGYGWACFVPPDGFSPVDSLMQGTLLGFQLCSAFLLLLQSPIWVVTA